MPTTSQVTIRDLTIAVESFLHGYSQMCPKPLGKVGWVRFADGTCMARVKLLGLPYFLTLGRCRLSELVVGPAWIPYSELMIELTCDRRVDRVLCRNADVADWHDWFVTQPYIPMLKVKGRVTSTNNNI